MNILKLILDVFKAPAVAEVTALQTNRDANIATIEALVGAGSGSAVAAVESFIAGAVKKNAALGLVYGFIAPQLTQFLAQTAASGVSDVPGLYDKVVAFLVKEEQYL